MSASMEDWAELVADRIVESVHAIMSNDSNMTVGNALECHLAQSCAGPEAIKRAMVRLGLK